MHISILTLFPEMFNGPFDYSIIKRAVNTDKVSLSVVNLRDFADNKYKSVDDHPYGGGVGMILRVDVIDRALSALKTKNSKVALLDPRGKIFNQKTAVVFSKIDDLILISGHYEGFDERVRKLVDYEVSIGDFILTGGEIPAMVIIDSVVRLLPGVLKNSATENESFAQKLLEYPQYTKPDIYKKQRVPEILLSGNHAAIEKWRQQQAKKVTEKNRPDLLK